jgi:hypothetical protein
MNNLKSIGMCSAFAAAIALTAGTAFAQQQETRSQTPQQRPQTQEQSPQRDGQQLQLPAHKKEAEVPGVDDAEPMLDNPDVETGASEESMVEDGQHGDMVHWSKGTLPLNGFESDDMVGSDVLDADNEVVGKVVRIVTNEENQILELIVETAGRMGLGGREVAVPSRDAEFVQTGEREIHFRIDTDLESLDDAPAHKRENKRD